MDSNREYAFCNPNVFNELVSVAVAGWLIGMVQACNALLEFPPQTVEEKERAVGRPVTDSLPKRRTPARTADTVFRRHSVRKLSETDSRWNTSAVF